MFQEFTSLLAHAEESSDGSGTRHARLIVEAECTTCGPLCSTHGVEVAAIKAALAHTAKTGHVVVLNGTSDLPETDGADCESSEAS